VTGDSSSHGPAVDNQPQPPPAAGAAPDVPKESARSILFQFVLFPLAVVLIGVAIFLLFGVLATEEHSIPDYVNQIRSGSAHERWQAAYQLSKSLKRGEARQYPDLAPQIAALYVAAQHDDPKVRRYLGMVLGNLGDRRATPVLLEGLNDRDPETRLFAILALAQIRDPASLPRLMAMTRDEEPDVRKTAAFALGESGLRGGIPALVAACEDPVADVRWNAAIALSRFGERSAIPVLRQMLDRRSSSRIPGVREDQIEDAMIEAMAPYARLEGRAAVPDLERIATTDPSLRIRAAAKTAVGLAGVPK
jgi:HEAT repeat protein